MGASATQRRSVGRPRGRATRAQQDLAKRIREALVLLGGEAHRATVIAIVARDFGLDDRHIPDDLTAAMILSFEDAWKDEERRAAYGFHLRFGEGSHRWGLNLEGTAANG
jgi:hypothetical protein